VALEKLPGWVVDDVTSVREEVAPYVNASVEQLWRDTQDCARAAMWAVRASGMAERVLAYEDPLPASTVAALERLRADMRARR
jgi:hypothetical protein